MTKQQEAIRETFRRVLQQTTLRAILRPAGRTPIDVTKEEQATLLEPYEAAIDADFFMCCEVADQLLALAESGQQVEVLKDEEQVMRFSTDDDENPST